MIVIFGATGQTGGAAARALLSEGKKVRAVGRTARRLSALAQLGADTMLADLTDAASVERALSGAVAAYLLIPPNFAVDDFRAYQTRVSDALLGGVRASGISRIVFLSSLGANHPTGTGPIVGLHEFEHRARSVRGLSVLSIRAGYFMENFLMNVGMVKGAGVFSAPAPRHAPLALIAAADIGRYAARRLAALDFDGFEVVNLTGPGQVTFAEVVQTLGRAVGKPDLPFVEVSYEDAAKAMVENGLKPDLASLYVELYQGAAQGLLAPEPGTAVVHMNTPFAAFASTFGAVYAQQATASRH